VRSGSVAARLEIRHAAPVDQAALGLLAAALDLALRACERQGIAANSLNETQVLQRVATRILKSHDLDEILLLITQETRRLLGADICGILLREGDEIAMRRCVGHLSPKTAALRMHQGQGLAGRVFATGEPCCVDDYVESRLISRDFFGLAQAEKVRSALGAPLISKDSVIGVLEVWRRHASTFTEQDTGRMVALANLTSIAIENARLYATQRSLLDLQRDLVQLLIEGGDLDAISARAAAHLRAAVLIVDIDMRVLGASPVAKVVPAALRAPLEAVLRGGAAPAPVPLCAQRISIGNEVVGLVAAYGEDLDATGAALAASQVAMSAALYRVEQRAASKAQVETLEGLLWDLLEGQDALRQAALDRARQMRAAPRGAVRVYLCSLTGVAGDVETCRRVARELCEQRQAAAGAQRFIGVRGNQVVFLLPDGGTDAAEKAARSLAESIARRIAGVGVHVGASAPQSDALALRKSFAEARVSADVAGQQGRAAGAVFERGGVVGVLLGLRQDGDIDGLVERTFGRLLQAGEHQRQVLLRTLQAFFDCNCSQQAAARQLRVHHKTVRYRLARIATLTGLDLATRKDRLLADLALYVNDIAAVKQKN